MPTRRAFISFLALSGAATLAAACSQPAPTAPAPTPAPTTAAKPVATTAPAAAQPTAAPKPAAPTTAPVAASKPATPPRNQVDADWDKIVAAAKQEGTVSVATYAGSPYRNILDEFQKANPGIKVEHTQFQSSSRDFVPRLLQELKAGLHSWDVSLMPAQEQLLQVRPIGGLDPIRSVLRSEVMQDKNWNWNNGFDGGFPDIDKKWGYSLVNEIYYSIWVNTDMVGPEELTKVQDLFDPKWRGKIIAADARTKGSGFSALTAMRMNLKSDDIVKQLYKDQEPSVGTDARQQTEMMVRGRFPVGFGAVDEQILKDFRAQGLGNNLAERKIFETSYFNSGSHTMWLLAQRTHPNAATVLVNWLMSAEAGAIYSKATEFNSARTEVPVFDDSAYPQKGLAYFKSNDEVNLPEIEKTQKLAKQVLD